MRAALGSADERLAAPRIVALIGTENAASLRVAVRCGFRVFASAAYNGAATHFLERSRPETRLRPASDPVDRADGIGG